MKQIAANNTEFKKTQTTQKIVLDFKVKTNLTNNVYNIL